jgi:hypothetical protein
MDGRMKTITNNEDYVRLRIYEGGLQVSEAAAELLRLERCQAQERERFLKERIDGYIALCEEHGVPLG